MTTINQNELNRALKLREIGEYQQAKEWLNQFIISHPEHAEALSLLSQILLLSDQLPESEEMLLKAASINSELPSVYCNRARLLLKKAAPAAALSEAQTGYSLFPDDIEISLVFANCLTANNQDEEALALIEDVLKIKSKSAEALSNRAIIHHRAGRISQAISDVENGFVR
jgi:tetratricopeptide (TPR) repeat protein